MSTTIYSANFSTQYSSPIYYNYSFRNPSLKLFCDTAGYYHLIYMIYNKISHSIYIGKHTTLDINDDYMGSGVALHDAYKSYGIENFEKIILYCLHTENDAYLKETQIVTPDFIARTDTYNLKCGGNGFCSYDVKGEKNYWYGKSLSGERNGMYGKQHTDIAKKKMADARQGKSPSNKGIPLTQEQKDKVSKALKEKFIGENNPFYNKSHTEESKRKISLTHIGKHRSEESKRKQSESNTRANNPNAKIIQKLDLEGYIIAEYGCMRDCYETENMSHPTLAKYIRLKEPCNGFYYRFKNID